MRWELMECNRNPMSLMKLKGLTKRVRQPRALSVEELHSLWLHLDEDTRTMSIVDASPGLRASELLGLRWEDFDWKGLRVKIQRSWVYGKVEATKTEGSEKWLPLDLHLVDILRRHREKMPDELLLTVGSLSVPLRASRGGRTKSCATIFGLQQRKPASVESGGIHFGTIYPS